MAQISQECSKESSTTDKLEPAVEEQQNVSSPPLITGRKSSASAMFGKKSSWINSFGSKLTQGVSVSPAEKEQTSSSFTMDSCVNLLDPPRTSSPKLNTESVFNEDKGECGTFESPLENRSLMNRLRRLSSKSSSPKPCISNSTASLAQSFDSCSSIRLVLNKHKKRKVSKIPELEGVLPKRVMFNKELLHHDPPQQIPSRHPKSGNIKVGPNGEITRQVSGMGSMLPQNYSVVAVAASKTAYEAAVRIANTLKTGSSYSRKSKFFSSYDDNDEDDVEVHVCKNLKIEKPLDQSYEKKNLLGEKQAVIEGEDEDDQQQKLQDDAKLEDIYTRCCHLREILPIPATMRQVKDKHSPLDILRLMNPRPTLIEVLSFTDFLSVVPVNFLILDNVCFSEEMFRAVFSSLLLSNSVLKLSLRNVFIDEKSWEMFCVFLSENTSMIKLDLSIQDDSTTTTSSGSADGKKSKRRVELKPDTNRSDLDWTLFSKALIARGGIEELIINGCMVPGEELDEIILKGCALRTKRLGLAMNDLHSEDFFALRQWVEDPKSFCEGLDLGGNDIFNYWVTVDQPLTAPHLELVSFNSSNLHNGPLAVGMMERLAISLNLKFLDLSANPGLFPGFTNEMSRILPTFSSLRRLHLEDNDLSSQTVIQLSETFSKCKTLVHVSLLGNRRIDNTACAAMTSAVDISNTLYRIEIDLDLISPTILRRMTHMCMVNMESLISGKIKNSEMEGLQGDELVSTASELAKAVGDILENDKDSDELTCQMVTESLIKRAITLKEWVKDTMEQLFQKRRTVSLSTEDKEGLIRLVFLDGNLEHVLNLYQARQYRDQHFDLKREEILMGITKNKSDNTIHSLSEQDHEVVRKTDKGLPLTSVYGKKQEQEEGEIHKLATFIQAHRTEEPSVDSLPDGGRLREAFLSAKGDRSVKSLIEEIEAKHGKELSKIIAHCPIHFPYSSHQQLQQLQQQQQEEKEEKEEKEAAVGTDHNNDEDGLSKTESNSSVEETLDMVIDNLAKVLSHD